MAFMDTVRQRVRGRGLRVVFPEGDEERAQRAAALLVEQGLAQPVLLGPRAAVEQAARGCQVELTGVELRDPQADAAREGYAAHYAELRAAKGVTLAAAREKLVLPHYFGAAMVARGDAHGMVAGLRSETKPFIPAFEIIRMKAGFKRASSVFVMCWPERTLFYADCSVNIAPDAETLAEIGRATAASARAFGHEPKVAFLSFSTRGSAQHADVDKVREAARRCRELEPGLLVDGELQFDAAFVPGVASRKCADSPLGGQANVFIFPDLDAGNIAYKITERLGGAAAVGPIMQGLRKPVNDVSRGCSVQDFADVATVTMAQALAEQA